MGWSKISTNGTPESPNSNAVIAVSSKPAATSRMKAAAPVHSAAARAARPRAIRPGAVPNPSGWIIRSRCPGPPPVPIATAPIFRPIPKSTPTARKTSCWSPAPSSPNTATPNPGVPTANGPSIKPAPAKCATPPSGPLAKATAAWLRYDLGLSYRKVQRLFDELFGLRFVPASAPGFDHQLTRRAGELYTDLRAKIKAAENLHADETHWRVDGVNHFLWYAGNEDLSCYHIDRHRSGAVATDLIGQHYEGLLHTDDYAAYNLVEPAHHQSCLAHHLRTARDLQEQLENTPRKSGPRSRTIKDFLQPLIQWIQRVCHARQQAAQASKPATALKPRRANWLKQLDRICARPLPEAGAETFRQRLVKHRERLLAFVEHPEGQPTNNAAEQALRPSVILRKITFGNRSAAGALHHSIITSLIQTAAKQAAAPRTVLQQLFCDQPAQARASLYPNSPDTS